MWKDYGETINVLIFALVIGFSSSKVIASDNISNDSRFFIFPIDSRFDVQVSENSTFSKDEFYGGVIKSRSDYAMGLYCLDRHMNVESDRCRNLMFLDGTWDEAAQTILVEYGVSGMFGEHLDHLTDWQQLGRAEIRETILESSGMRGGSLRHVSILAPVMLTGLVAASYVPAVGVPIFIIGIPIDVATLPLKPFYYIGHLSRRGVQIKKATAGLEFLLNPENRGQTLRRSRMAREALRTELNGE
jgi:hypothetical protein